MPGTDIGIIHRIVRYPVKSFAGEPIAEGSFERYGLRGDRGFAFIDETKTGFDRYITARQIPEMQAFRAAFEEAGEESLQLAITTPEGRKLVWGEELRREIASRTKQPVSLLACDPARDELMAVDEAMVLLVNDASIRELERQWGRKVDERRFRANVYIRLPDEGARPFAEESWIGRELALGTARLKVYGSCSRCVMVGIDPDRFDRDDSLFRLLSKERQGCFGVYATVVKPGRAVKGDAVRLIE